MERRFDAVTAALMSAIAVVVFAGATAHAQGIPACDPVIVDDAGVLTDMSRVQHAAASLERRGAIVRVRTIRTFGSVGSLDHYRAAIVRACSSWRAPNGENRDNLFALLVAMDDHEVGIYTGVDWARINDAHGVAIQADVMGPRLRDGDVAGAFVAAMEEFGRLVEASRPSVGGTPMHGLGGAGVVVVQQGGGTDSGTRAGVVLLVLLGLVALVLLVIGIASVRRSNQRRRAAQEIARDKRHAATSGLLEVRGKLPGLRTRTDAAALMLSDADAGRLRGKFLEFDRMVGAMALTMSEVEPEGSQDPTRDGRSREEYETVAQGYERALVQLRDIQAKQASHDAELDALHAAAKEAPAAIDAAGAAIVQTVGAIDRVKKGGLKVAQAQEALAQVRTVYLAAIEHREAKRLVEAQKSAEEARAGAEAAQRLSEGLPKRKADLDAFLGKLEQRLGTMPTSIADGRSAFDRISERCADACVEPVEGNGSRAEAEVERAHTAIATSRTAATMEEQRWDDAEAAAKDADAALDRAATLIQAIHVLEGELRRAEESAAQEIAAAQADIERATVYEQQHDADIDDAVKAELHQARATLTQARTMLTEARPNVLEVVRLAQVANSQADRTLARCQTEHEAAERLRRQAANAVRDAESAITKARSYITSHGWDVEGGANRLLATAEASLTRARQAEDVQSRLREAQRARAEAGDAYRQARNDVAETDDGLDDVASFAAGVAIGSAMGSSRRSSGGGGGGYRPSSSPSRSSGRSTSFGGGGSRSSGRSTSFGSGGSRSSGRATKW